MPLDESGNITNDRRIVAALPTLTTLVDSGAALIVMSHLGQPEGDPGQPDFRLKNKKLTMNRVAERLRQHLGRPVAKVDEVVGPTVTAAAQALKPGGVLLLENLRFHPGGEEQVMPNSPGNLPAWPTCTSNDAFGTCHRSDSSMLAVPTAMAKGKPSCRWPPCRQGIADPR